MSGLFWGGFILCNSIWALNPTVAKIIIGEAGPVTSAWLRYFGAFVSYLVFMLVFCIVSRVRGRRAPAIFLKPRSWKDAFMVATIGLTTCFFSPLTQMIGLSSTTAVNNVILVALEPIFTVLFSALLLRERLTRIHLASFGVALLGFGLLSRVISPVLWSTGQVAASVGDFIIAASIAGEAMYSIYGKLLSVRHSGTAIFGTALGVGATCLTGVMLAVHGVPALSALSWKAWLAVFWIGPVGTAVTYFFWLYALRKGVSIASLAVTLFIQPVVGAIAGIWFWKEPLTVMQAAGGLLILGAVLFQGLGERPLASAKSGIQVDLL